LYNARVIEQNPSLRIAAVGDLHISDTSEWGLSSHDAERIIFSMAESADVLLFLGDLIHTGRKSEAETFASIVETTNKPALAILGNHEILRETPDIVEAFREKGIVVLQGEKTGLPVDVPLEVIGIKGGYDGSLAEVILAERKKLSDSGRERLTPELSQLRKHVQEMGRTRHILLTHYPPILETVMGEDPEQHDLHGSAEIGRIADLGNGQMQAIFHGHTHRGQHSGKTEKGIPVYNVALPALARTCGIPREEVTKTPPVFVAEFSREGKFLKTVLSR
jgi:uncharacterized protein